MKQHRPGPERATCPSGLINARLQMETLPTTLFPNAEHEIVERVSDLSA